MQAGNFKQCKIIDVIIKPKSPTQKRKAEEMLDDLRQMWVSDERFKKNIDNVGGDGNAEFVKQAISVYCFH